MSNDNNENQLAPSVLNWRRRALQISIAATLLWWVSGFVWEPKPSWWQGIFMTINVIAMGFVWLELRRIAKDLSDRREEEENLLRRTHAFAENGVQGSVMTAVMPDVMQGLNGSVAVRNFASLDDARQYGWVFGDQIGTYDDLPLYRTAKKEGDASFFVFDGLARNKFPVVISDAFVAFGRMMYKKEITETGEQTPDAPRSTGDFALPDATTQGSSSVFF